MKSDLESFRLSTPRWAILAVAELVLPAPTAVAGYGFHRRLSV